MSGYSHPWSYRQTDRQTDVWMKQDKKHPLTAGTAHARQRPAALNVSSLLILAYMHLQGFCSNSGICRYGGVSSSVTRRAVYLCDGKSAEAGEGVRGALRTAVPKEQEEENQVREPTAPPHAVHHPD